MQLCIHLFHQLTRYFLLAKDLRAKQEKKKDLQRQIRYKEKLRGEGSRETSQYPKRIRIKATATGPSPPSRVKKTVGYSSQNWPVE